MDFEALNQLLTHGTRLFFLLVSLISVVNLLIYRTRVRLDIALLFGMLGLVVLEQILRPILPDNVWFRLLPSLLLMSIGHLTLRLVQHFRPVPLWLRVFSAAGLIASWVLLVLYPTAERPVAITIVLVFYLLVLEVYAVTSFIRGAATTSGVSHWRLTLVALATGFIAAVFLISGINAAIPAAAPYTRPLSSLMGLLSAATYYFGFAPPRWLRRYWQLSELQQFLQEGMTATAETSPDEHLDRLARFAARSVGAIRSLVGLWDDTKHQLNFVESEDFPDLNRFVDSLQTTARTLEKQSPRLISLRGQRNNSLAELGQTLGSDVVYVIPLLKSARPLGVLLVFMRYASLFPDDDQDILRLLAESSATDLEYVKLLDEQRSLLDKLNKRTTQLEDANRELEAFAYTVSHDLRAPLRAVDGFGRILDEDYRQLLPPDGQETLDFILQNSRQMGQLIDDLLMFSRLGRTEVTRAPIDMKELAREVVNEQVRGASGRKIDVKLEDLPTAEANRNLMKQVLANLVSNAIKFTRARDRAEIKIGWQQQNGHPIYFVRDNGVGFDMQYASKLFGVFQRLQNPEDYEGTGVGLAIVQRIIRKHGGRVWAEAEPDKGATFYFEIGEAELE